MKKILAMLLALVLVLSLAACGAKAPAPTANPADAIADEMTSNDGKYQVAFITDVGQLKDKGFNQGSFDGVKMAATATRSPTSTISPLTAMLLPMRIASTP